VEKRSGCGQSRCRATSAVWRRYHVGDATQGGHCPRIVKCVALVVLLVSSGLLLGGAGPAKQRAQPFRIGALTSSWGPTPGIVAVRDGLLALGYRDGEQFEIGVRFTQGDMAILPAAAHELLQYGVDLILASGEASARAAQRATNQIPIVFIDASDPLGAGLIQSFARPGGNITGVANLSLELGPKRLQVFKELIPGLQRVLFPYDTADAPAVAAVQVYRDAARHLGIELVEQVVHTEEEAQATLAAIRQGEVDGILSHTTTALNIDGFILEATARQAIPSMFAAAILAEHGGLASYGPDLYESGRQAVRLVDKILQGAKPAELPVEVNNKIEFVINLKTAQTLGLTIAPEVLFQADRLIR
jgi:putative ABC transport system substrate-binding protein